MNWIAAKKLYPYIIPYRRQFFFAIFIGLLFALTSGLPAVLGKYLIDDGFVKKNISLLTWSCVAIVVLYIINGFFRYIHYYLLIFYGEKVCADIQIALQQKFMDLSLAYHSENDSGANLSKVINDVNNIKVGLLMVADILREPFTAIALLGWIIYLDWKLTLLVIVLAPILALTLKQFGKSIRKYSHQQQETLENLTSTFKETLDGVRIIQGYNLQQHMKQRLMRVVDNYLTSRRKIITRQESAGPVSDWLGAIAFTIAAFYIGVQIIEDKSTLGNFVSFIAALGILQKPVKKVQDAYVRLQPSFVAAERILRVLENPQVVTDKPASRAFNRNFNNISFKDISFRYPHASSDSLSNINLDVNRGEVIAFVGTSGSGKSTLVNLLARFMDPTSGCIFVDGVDIREFRLKDLRSNVALVTQDVFLFNDTIAENIRAGSPVSVEKTIQAAELANANKFIEAKPNKFESTVGERGSSLSGGEKQRVSIARAIYKDAPILILDEATSALDSASEVEVQKGLDELMHGRTTFVIAHRLSTVMRADRILVMEHGKIIESGTHRELIQMGGKYSELESLQLRSFD
ncbi:MAG: ABC transporter ATP-binding protein [Bdellovibrionales bacterium CG10_big_fil_rev_8_21_14_0_10_45_34]|nr:MAG: ABC transporter ATP-binding protein [Bdellovibrionales bacterium CG10_big_fil_rev_8_21_14_0_10_45_34]